MKQLTVGVFNARERAEQAITRLNKDKDVSGEDISYVYRNESGEVRDANELTDASPGEGAATGATVGGTIGAIAGLATAAGAIPVIGPIFAAGPLISALGLSGAVATAAAGAATGAAAGGMIGALVSLGVSRPDALKYEDKVRDGKILVTVHADETKDVADVLQKSGAQEVNIYAAAV